MADAGDDAPVALTGQWRSFMLGQCSHLLRVSLWWSGLSPLAFALVGRDSAVGAVRVAFNIALLLFSPMAGAIAERVPIERILTVTTLVRGMLYVVVLPLVWLLFRSDLVWLNSVSVTFVALVVICFLDGIQVAFATIVDVDMGGVDLLGGQRGMEVTDALRNRMNAIYHIVFDGSFLIFTPACALLGWYVGETAVHADGDEKVDTAKSGILVGIFAVVFFITCCISLYYYTVGLRKSPAAVEAGYEPLAHDASDEGAAAMAAAAAEGSEHSEALPGFGSIFTSIGEGAMLCWKTRPIRWRLLFAGLEIALEDAMVAVIVAEYAFTSRFFGDGDPTRTNLYTAAIIAVGKIGAIAAGSFMHSVWRPPTNKREYRPLFYSVLLSSVSVCLLILAHHLELSHPEQPRSPTAIISRGLVFVSVILFFLFSTAPKIGFETLLQGMASSVEGSGKIFGFVGPFISITDSIIVMGFSLAFALFKERCDADDMDCRATNFGHALTVCCGIFLAHGVFECVLGPRLMLPREGELLRSIGLNNNNE